MTPTHRLLALLGLLLLMSWPGVRAVDLPDIGDNAAAALSPDEERRLGENLMRRIRAEVGLVDDPEINDYLQALGYRLVAESDNHTQAFTFFVVNERAINAFAAPGGYVGINSGLILITTNESELASVLAHEIAHVTQHHFARTMEKINRFNLPATAALIAAIILAGRDSQSAQVAQAAAMATLAGTQQAALNFSRTHEQEADRVGIQSLARAGFDPHAMPSFFERLQFAMRYNEGDLPELLRTHPVTVARIADARNRADQFPRQKFQDSATFYLIRAKMRVLTSNDMEKTTTEFAAALTADKPEHREANHYGHALALLALERYAPARTELEALLKKDPNNLSYTLAHARLLVSSGHPDDARAALDKALRLSPQHYALTVAYAKLLLETGQAKTARDLIQNYLPRRPNEPQLYLLLARAEDQVGRSAEGHQALAEYYYLEGKTHSAIEQLDLAKRAIKSNDQYYTTRIDARRQVLQDELKLEMQRQ